MKDVSTLWEKLGEIMEEFTELMTAAYRRGVPVYKYASINTLRSYQEKLEELLAETEGLEDSDGGADILHDSIKKILHTANVALSDAMLHQAEHDIDPKYCSTR